MENEGIFTPANVIGNELKFPVPEKKPKPSLDKKKLFRIFLLGFFLITGTVMGIRCSFFVGADFTDGIVKEIVIVPFGGKPPPLFKPLVAFSTNHGEQVTFTGAENLKLKRGERVRVIYKKNNPHHAAVYSFFGFWFVSILICQVILLFWVGFLVVWYGYYP